MRSLQSSFWEVGPLHNARKGPWKSFLGTHSSLLQLTKSQFYTKHIVSHTFVSVDRPFIRLNSWVYAPAAPQTHALIQSVYVFRCRPNLGHGYTSTVPRKFFSLSNLVVQHRTQSHHLVSFNTRFQRNNLLKCQQIATWKFGQHGCNENYWN
jgi:hypothetical protein